VKKGSTAGGACLTVVGGDDGTATTVECTPLGKTTAEEWLWLDRVVMAAVGVLRSSSLGAGNGSLKSVVVC